MTSWKTRVLVAALFATGAGADEFVDKADANGDGFVSLHELRAAHYADPDFNRRIEESFARHDLDGDGRISAEERRARRPEAGDGERAGRAAASSPGVEDPATEQELGAIGHGAIRRQVSSRGGATARPSTQVSRRSADRPTTHQQQSWIERVDTDGSGGASVAELIASGDGERWFSDGEFEAADVDGDGDLDGAEYALLVRSLERRQRR